MATRDIRSGEFWATRLLEALDTAQFGVCVVTADSIASPWVNFEVGAMAARLGGRVCPYTLDVESSELWQLSSPLAGLNCSEASYEGTRKLVSSIAQCARERGEHVPDAVDKEIFEVFWPKLHAKIAAIPDLPRAARPNVTLDDVINLLQTIEWRTRKGVELPRRESWTAIATTVSREPPRPWNEDDYFPENGRWDIERLLANFSVPAVARRVAEKCALRANGGELTGARRHALDRYLQGVERVSPSILGNYLHDARVAANFNANLRAHLPAEIVAELDVAMEHR